MPLEVPRYDEPLVRPAPAPGPRQPQQAPLEAFGGGRAAEGAFRASGELAQAAGQINQQAFNQEAEAGIRDYVAQLSAEEARLKSNLQTLKGEEAFGATEKTLRDFDSSRDKLLSGIASPYVRDRVGAHSQAFRDSLFRSSEMYVAGEREDYAKRNTAALVSNERNNAGTDYVDPESPARPQRVMEAIARQRAAIADQLHGQSPQTIAAAQAIEESKTHSLVLDRMLAGGNDLLAKNYYEANQAGFFGEDKVQAERALEHSSYVGEAQRETDRIFAPTWKPIEGALAGSGLKVQATPGAQNMDDVRKATVDIKDPKLRAAVEAMSRQRLEDMKHAERQRAMETYEAAAKLVDANPDTKPEFLVPGGQWTQLPAEYRDALNRRAAKEADDSKAWLQWMDFARDEQRTAALPRADFEAMFWSRLTPAHREKASDRWSSAGEAVAKGGAKLVEYKSFKTDKEEFLHALQRAQIGGITVDDTIETIQKDKTKRKAYIDYEDRVDDAFKKHLADTGKNPDDQAKQSIINKLIMREKSVKIQNPLWFDPEKKIKDLTDDEIHKVESGYEQIPATSIDNMKRMASTWGLTLDPEKNSADQMRLARAYVAALLGKGDLVKSILSGKE